MTLEEEPASYIQLDLFPGTVTLTGPDPDEVLGDQFRVIVTDNFLYVIEDSFEGPVAKVKEELVGFSGSNKTGYVAETENTSYNIARTNHCGCGSRLRGFRLFQGVPHVSQMPK